MAYLTSNNSNICFSKASKEKIYLKSYTSQSFKYSVLQKYLLILHAFSSCGIISATFRQRNRKFVKTPDNYFQDLSIVLTPFLQKEVGQTFKRYLGHTKNDFKFHCFEKATAKATTNCASIPPICKVAREHSFRVYHQLQNGLRNPLLLTDWGYCRKCQGL